MLSGLCSLFCLGFSPTYCVNLFVISAGQRVLELGCGAGLLGVILHRADAAAVCLTDGDAQALHNCRHNLHINGAEVCTQPSCRRSWAWQHAQCPPTSSPGTACRDGGLCFLLALTASGMILTRSGKDEHSGFLQGGDMSTRVMSWTERPVEPCNVLLAADILYDPGKSCCHLLGTFKTTDAAVAL